MAEIRRLLKEVGHGLNEDGPPMFEIGERLKGINESLREMGCQLDQKLFDGIDHDTDYIKKKKYKRFLPGDRVKIEASLRPVRIKGRRGK